MNATNQPAHKFDRDLPKMNAGGGGTMNATDQPNTNQADTGGVDLLGDFARREIEQRVTRLFMMADGLEGQEREVLELHAKLTRGFESGDPAALRTAAGDADRLLTAVEYAAAFRAEVGALLDDLAGPLRQARRRP